MVQQLRTIAALPEDPCQFLALTLGSLQLPVTPNPRDSAPSSGLFRHLHTCACTCTHTHVNFFLTSQIYNCLESGMVDRFRDQCLFISLLMPCSSNLGGHKTINKSQRWLRHQDNSRAPPRHTQVLHPLAAPRPHQPDIPHLLGVSFLSWVYIKHPSFKLCCSNKAEPESSDSTLSSQLQKKRCGVIAQSRRQSHGAAFIFGTHCVIYFARQSHR